MDKDSIEYKQKVIRNWCTLYDYTKKNIEEKYGNNINCDRCINNISLRQEVIQLAFIENRILFHLSDIN